MTSADEVVATFDNYAAEQTGLISEANARAATAVAQADALRAQVADLQAQLAALEHPPTTPLAVVGSALWRHGTETLAQAYTRTKAALGIQAVRVYASAASGGLRHALDQVAELRAAGHTGLCYISFVESIPETLAGKLDGYYLVQFARLSDKDRLAGWHESDRHSLKLREYTPADVVAAQRHLFALHANIAARGSVGQIVTGYDLEHRWPLFDVGDANREWVGIDPYAAQGETALGHVKPILDFLRQRTSQPLAVTEIGGWYTPQDPAFVASLAELRPLVDAVLWFEALDAGNNLDFQIAGLPACAAALKAMTT